MRKEKTIEYVFRIIATEKEHKSISDILKNVRDNFGKKYNLADVEYFKKGLIKDCFAQGFKIDEEKDVFMDMKGVKLG